MNKNILMTVGVAAMSLSIISCINGPEENLASCGDVEMKEVTIVANIGDETTKSSLDGTSVCWETGDQIRVYISQYSNSYVLTLNPQDAGKASGRFTGTMPASSDGPFAAVYPASVGLTREYISSLEVSIPSTQTYKKNSFSKGTNIAFAHTDDLKKALDFTNSGSLLVVPIKGTTKIRRIVLSSSSDSFLAAEHARISYDTAESYSNFSIVSGASKSVTLDCGESGATLTHKGLDFYFYVPADRLASGFMLEIEDMSGNVMVTSAPASEQNRTVRSKITRMPVITFQATIQKSFAELHTPGAYINYTTTPVCQFNFVSNGIQCGAERTSDYNVFRLQNWNDEWVALLQFPKNIQVGESYKPTVVKAIGENKIPANINQIFTMLSQSQTPVKVLKKENGFAWLEYAMSPSMSYGLIINVLD